MLSAIKISYLFQSMQIFAMGKPPFSNYHLKWKVLIIHLLDETELHSINMLGKYNMARTGVGLIFIIFICKQVWLPLHTHLMWSFREISADGVSLCMHLSKIFYNLKPLSPTNTKYHYRLQLEFNLTVCEHIPSTWGKRVDKIQLNSEVKNMKKHGV